MKYFTKEVKFGLTGAVAIAALFIGLNFLKGINPVQVQQFLLHRIFGHQRIGQVRPGVGQRI